MATEKYVLWDITPGTCEEIPTITVFISENKKSNGAIVII